MLTLWLAKLLYDDNKEVYVQERSTQHTCPQSPITLILDHRRQIWPIHIHEQVTMNTQDKK
jgi:hypothetical protein